MAFNTFAFAAFLTISFVLYWIVPQKTKWIILLAVSIYFYMSWNAKNVIWLLLIALVSFVAANILEQRKNKAFLIPSVALILLVLFFFKYYNFIIGNVQSIFELCAIPMEVSQLDLIMPVGLSFYTFQVVGYIVDVYKGKTFAEHNFGKYLLFVSFFPQVVSGPIARAPGLMSQISEIKVIDYNKATHGMKRIAWGAFEKFVIADTIAKYIDPVYSNISNYTGFSLVLAMFLYSIQIYCDFSGYSNIAIGIGSLFGIDLIENFKSPYLSDSVKEFWSRWHISLSTWLRDYVYIPLGGNRKGKMRRHFNLMTAFLISGLWHGANWTFIIWGG